jgi:hypothetical protein
LILSVPDDGYSINMLFTLNFIIFIFLLFVKLVLSWYNWNTNTIGPKQDSQNRLRSVRSPMVRYWYVTIDFDCLKKNVRHWIESDNFVLQQGTSNSPTPNRCLVIRGCWKLSFMYAMRVAFFKHKSPIYIQCMSGKVRQTLVISDWKVNNNDFWQIIS